MKIFVFSFCILVSQMALSQTDIPDDETVMLNPARWHTAVAISENEKYLVKISPFYFNDKGLRINKVKAFLYKEKNNNFYLMSSFPINTDFPRKLILNNSGIIVTGGLYKYGKNQEVVVIYNKKGEIKSFIDKIPSGNTIDDQAHKKWICWGEPFAINENSLILLDQKGYEVKINLKNFSVTTKKNFAPCG